MPVVRRSPQSANHSSSAALARKARACSGLSAHLVSPPTREGEHALCCGIARYLVPSHGLLQRRSEYGANVSDGSGAIATPGKIVEEGLQIGSTHGGKSNSGNIGLQYRSFQPSRVRAVRDFPDAGSGCGVEPVTEKVTQGLSSGLGEYAGVAISE
jgi:hypothetical protein